MEIYQPTGETIETSWSSAWAFVTFKKRFLIVSILFAAVLLYYPYFFNFIQHRPGKALNDPFLSVLPSLDMSAYIFPLIYLTVGLGLFRAIQSPALFLLFLWSCLFFSLSRIITMTLVPLDPPLGLIPLADPILMTFYRHNNITKDLFYSGHTGSVFLIYLFLKKKWEKAFALIATILVGALLLVQHIHYTVDVLFAPLIVYFVFILAKKVNNA